MTMVTKEEIPNFQDVPLEPFLTDLKKLCRGAWETDWTPKGASQAGMEHLRQHSFLPEAFLAYYETVGGEPCLIKQGLLPAEQTYIDHERNYSRHEFLVYYKPKRGEEFSFARLERDCPCGGVAFYSANDTYTGFLNTWSLAYSDRQALSEVLLRHTGVMLSRSLPNCVWVKVSLSNKGSLSPYQAAAKRLGMEPLDSVSWGWHAFAADEEKGLLLEFCDDVKKKCLVYSQDPKALEALGERFQIFWERRDGEKILNPETFIQTPPPKTFGEKLDLMASVLLGKRSMALPMNEIEKAEKRLGMVFPEPLREFYLRFGKGGKLLTDESLNTIYTPKQLKNYTVEQEDDDQYADLSPEELSALGGDLVLAEENQTVWWCRLDQKTGRPYLDLGDGKRQELDMDLEDTLLWLLAQQSLGFLARGGPCEIDQEEKSRSFMEHFFIFLNKGPQEIFVNPDRGLVGCRENEGLVYIKARQGKALEKLEEDTGLLVGDF